MDPTELPQKFDDLHIAIPPPPGFPSTTYAIKNLELLRKKWNESAKPIPTTELLAYLNAIASIQAYHINARIRDPEACSFAIEIVKALEGKVRECNPNCYPYIIEFLITLCLADPDSKSEVQNLFMALATQPIGPHYPPAVYVVLCNGHQFFDFPQRALLSRLKEHLEPFCKATSDTPLSLNELLTITICFAKYREKDGFLPTLQGILKTHSDLASADTDKLTRLSVSLSRHPECDDAFVMDLLHILMSRPWSGQEAKVKRILYCAANLSNPARDIQERLCRHYEAQDQSHLMISQLAALSQLPIQQEEGRRAQLCRLKAEVHRQLMVMIQQSAAKLKSKDPKDHRKLYKLTINIQDHHSEFEVDDFKDLILCLINISKVSRALLGFTEKSFLVLSTRAHSLVQTPTLLTWLCRGHTHFRFSDPLGITRLQSSIEYHCQKGHFSTDDLLTITTAFATYGKSSGFVSALQFYLKKRGDLESQDLDQLTQATKSLSTHPERDEALIIALLQPQVNFFEISTSTTRLVVLNAVGRLAHPPQAFQETLCKHYFDEDVLYRSNPNEIALLARMPLVQEEPQLKKLQRIKQVLHGHLARCERGSLAALIVAVCHAKEPDPIFLNALNHAICQEEEPISEAHSLEDQPVGTLFFLAKRYSQNKDVDSLRALIEEFFRRQALWNVLFWNETTGFRESLKIEEEENILHAPLSGPACNVLLRHCMRSVELEESLQDLIDLLQNGRLIGRYRMPSDHLPIGAMIAGIKLMSWNVLNNAYMDWITNGKCKALKNSLITHLDVRLQIPLRNEDKGLTNRDVRVAKMIVAAINKGIDIFALQECSEQFLQALAGRLPKHFKIVKKCDYPVVNQEVFVFNCQRLLPRPDLNPKQVAFYKGMPDRTIFSFTFEIADTSRKILRLFNAHVPGDQKIKGHEQFASHVAANSWPDEIVCAVGDYNYERQEVLHTFKNTQLQATCLSPWDTNIGPDSRVKSIDHILVQGTEPVALKPDELLPKSYLLQQTIEFLQKKKAQKKRAP